MRWLAVTVLFAVPAIVHPAPFFEQTDLFEAGKDGYALYRIPGIVVTGKGTVLAYCEARKNAGSDWGHIDLMLRRSTDGGKTWGERKQFGMVEGKIERNPAAVKQKLGKEGEITFNNPVAIVEPESAVVHFLYCVEYGRCFYVRSDDDGGTFSKPVEITKTFEAYRSHYDWKVLATGPGHGIRLKNGRLIVPVWLSTGTGGHAHRPSCVSVIYSDDQGKNWKPGEVVVDNPVLTNPSETAAVELSDGRVMLNMRHESKPNLRAVTTSDNGVTGYTKPRLDKDLPEPICFGSLVRFDAKRILFVNPDNPSGRERKNVTVRVSEDDGQSWKVKKAIEVGPSGYADVAVGGDGMIYCFYERGRGDKVGVRSLSVARFNLEWVMGK